MDPDTHQDAERRMIIILSIIADDPRMTEPRPYNLADPAEVDRLHHELQGYMRVSLQDGTDTEGRAHAYDALCELNRRKVRPTAPKDGGADGRD